MEEVAVPWCYHQEGFGTIKRAELHTFSDASQDAIAAAVYLRLINEYDDINVALVYRRAKVKPIRPPSIPRLELCGAVLATQVTSKVLKEIDMEISDVFYYTDSQVVLGYITNETRRFYVYVANRVQLIRSLSQPEQWRYIETDNNPADLATRGIRASTLQRSLWIHGPDFLKKHYEIPDFKESSVGENDPEVRRELHNYKTNQQRTRSQELGAERFTRFSNFTSLQRGLALLSENDPEVRRELHNYKTNQQRTRSQELGAERFTRFSNFTSLQRGLALLIARIRAFRAQQNTQQGTSHESTTIKPTPKELRKASELIVRESQNEALKEEILQARLRSENQVPAENSLRARQSDIHRLNAFVDQRGLLRVGGRLSQMSMDYEEKHPIILPKYHHVSTLLVRHFHHRTHH